MSEPKKVKKKRKKTKTKAKSKKKQAQKKTTEDVTVPATEVPAVEATPSPATTPATADPPAASPPSPAIPSPATLSPATAPIPATPSPATLSTPDEEVRPIRTGEQEKIEAWETESKYTNPRGIYRMRFITDVKLFLASNSPDGDVLSCVEQAMAEMEEFKMKYGIMTDSLDQQKQQLSSKIPDMVNALQTIKYLKKKKTDESIKTQFLLSDGLFACAEVPTKNTVYLWLGANVMMQYEYDEAEKVLTENKKNCKTKLERFQRDLDFLKDQLTIAQVNYSRLHNFRVSMRKQIMAARK